MNTIHNLPRPGAPHLDNVCATILQCDEHNRREWLNLDRIADAQGFDRASFAARFAELQTQMSLRACGECEK
jgi:hypothetical protein